MKTGIRLVLTIWALIWSVMASAQISPTAARLSAGEYFFDTDPGVGNGLPVNIGAASDSINQVLALPIGSLSSGIHTLFFRVRNGANQWSLAESRTIVVVSSSGTVTGPITAAEFFFDTDPGVGNATAISIGSPADSLNAVLSLPTGSLPSGIHTLYVRFKNSTGSWSLAESRTIVVTSPVVLNNEQIVQAEFFIDTDPGVGNGTAVSIGSPTDSLSALLSLPVGSLTPGVHNLYFRVKNNSGKWSLAESRTIVVTAPVVLNNEQIVSAEFFFDVDPGVGNGNAVSIGSPTDSLNTVFSLPTGALAPGIHNLFFRVKSISGKWSLSEPRTLVITSPIVLNNEKIVSAEFYFDTDPGAGNGNSVNIGSPTDSLSALLSLPVGSITPGIHNLFFRVKSNSGKWSLAESRTIVVTPPVVSNNGEIVSAEFFIDTDPGVGNGRPIAISPSGDSINQIPNLVIPITTTQGIHFIYIRVKNRNNQWSLYEVDTISVLGCTNTANVTLPQGNTACVGQSILLVGSAGAPGSTFQWKRNGLDIPGATNDSLFATLAGDYTLSTLFDTCAGLSLPVTLTFLSAPTANITPSSAQIICAGNTRTLTANAGSGLRYQWFRNGQVLAADTNRTIVVADSGSYTVRVTNAGNCSTLSSATRVDVQQTTAPVISTADATTFCSGGSALLSSNVSASIVWFINGSSTGVTTATFSATTSGTYTARQIISGCSSESNAISITVNGVPSTPLVSASSSTTFCTGDSVMLSSNAVSGNQWLLNGNTIPGATGNSLTVFASGNYSVRVTVSGCSSVSSSTTLTVNPFPSTPTVSAGGPTTFCLGGSVVLTSSAASGNQWFRNDTLLAGQTGTTLNVSQSGSFKVRTTVNGCTTISGNTVVNVTDPGAAPLISASGPLTICFGDSVTLSSNLGGNLQWLRNGSPLVGSTSTSITVNQAGSYTVTRTVSGCPVTSAATTVNVNGRPVPVITSSSGFTICTSGNKTLRTNSGFSSYQWFLNGNTIGGANDSFLVVNTGGNYTVAVVLNGCSGTSAVQTVIQQTVATPVLTVSGPSSVCTPDSVTLVSNQATGNVWFFGAVPMSVTGQTIRVAFTGSYSVRQVLNGCTSANSNTISVSVNTPPAAPVVTAGGPLTFCSGDSVVLSSSALTGNQWLLNGGPIAGANAATLVVRTSGTYTVAVTSNACTVASAPTSVVVNALPSLPVITPASPISLCRGSSVTLRSSLATDNQWFINGSLISGAIADTLVADSAASYTIQTGSVCVVTSAPVVVQINNTPPSFVFAGVGNFASQLVDPLIGTSATVYTFQVKYTDVDGHLPATGFPKLRLDFEGNGLLSDPNDIIQSMVEADPLDTDVTDGKIYTTTVSGLPIGVNYQTSFMATDALGCSRTSNALSQPDVGIGLPDLRCGLGYLGSRPIVPFDTLPFVMQVVNLGTLSSVPCVASVLLNGVLIHTEPIPSIPPNTRYDFAFNRVLGGTGIYELALIADTANVVAETNENNNINSILIPVGNTVLPGNIECIAMSLVPNPAIRGTDFDITGTLVFDANLNSVSNNTFGPVGALVTMVIVETNDTFRTSANSGSLQAVDFNFTRPMNLLPGTYHLHFDFEQSLLTGSFDTLFTVIPPPPGPNIVAALFPTNPVRQGQPASGRMKLSNNGTNSTGPFVARLSTCDGVIGVFNISNLNPGDTLSQIFNYQFNNPPFCDIVLVADVNSQVTETEEGDNTATATVRVNPVLPDITASSIDFPATAVSRVFVVGTQVTMEAGFTNAGITPTGNFSFRILENGVQVATGIVNSLDSSGTRSVPFQYTPLAGGARTLTLEADLPLALGGSVAEFNEFNNTFSRVFPVSLSLPNLLKDNSTFTNFSPLNPAIGTSATVSFTIRNNGAADAGTGVPVHLRRIRNGVQNGATLVFNSSALLRNQISTPQFAYLFDGVQASDTFQFEIDPSDVLEETSENDNNFSFGLCKDFRILNPAASGVSLTNLNSNAGGFRNIIADTLFARLGDSVFLNFPIVNDGLMSGVNVKYMISQDGSPIKTDSISTVFNTLDINPTRFYVVGVPVVFSSIREGSFTITVDPDSVSGDCHRANNTRTFVYRVLPPLPDFSMDLNGGSVSVRIFPRNPDVNQPTDISIRVKNLTSVPSDSFTVKMFVGTTDTFSTRYAGLRAGADTLLLFASGFQFDVPGLNQLSFVVDVLNEVEEISEFNNFAIRDLIVGDAPNLFFTDIRASNLSPNVLDTIHLTSLVTNEGDVATTALVRYSWNSAINPALTLFATDTISVNPGDTVLSEADYVVLSTTATIHAQIRNANPLEFNPDDNDTTLILGGSNALFVSVSTTNPLCARSASGSATAVISGGTPPFSFLWSNQSVSQSIVNVLAGNYTVTVTDSVGAQFVASGSVIDPPLFDVSIQDVNLGINECNGLLTTTITGGIGQIDYFWSTNEFTEDISILFPGLYSITVFDSAGCSATDSFVSNRIIPLSTTSTVIQPSCFGFSNGSVQVTTSGGQSPYGFVWSNNATTEDISGLAAGNFSLTITDQRNCELVLPVEIQNPAAIQVIVSASDTLLSCPGGPVTLTSNQSTGNQWFKDSVAIPGAINLGILANAPGLYFSRVTNLAGCVFQSNLVRISNPGAVTPTVSISGPASICAGEPVQFIATTNILSNNPRFVWKVNGINQGINNAVFSTSSVTGGDTVICEVSSTDTCLNGNFAVSNSLIITVNILRDFFADLDNDGFGDLNTRIQDCIPPPGFVSDSTDCDDTRSFVNPGRTEVCNTLDDDCNGLTDEGVLSRFFADSDNDAFGNAAMDTFSCSKPIGFTEDSTDCDDGNPDINPGGVVEICNLVDDDCDGLIDEGTQQFFYADTDGDGFGDDNNDTVTCSAPIGYVINPLDCDDTDSTINPDTRWFRDLDQDGFGDPLVSLQQCFQPALFVRDSTDCIDFNNQIHPGATEILGNGIDEDCNGTDSVQLILITFFADTDGDGFGNAAVSVQDTAAPAGFVINSGDCNDGNSLVNPVATEVCNGIDDDCDRQTDEGVLIRFFADADNDGFGNSTVDTFACSIPAGFVSNSLDCDDTNGSIHPGATEILGNGMDEDCNGTDSVQLILITFFADTDGDGFGNAAVSVQDTAAPAGFVINSGDCNDGNSLVNPVATEVCNGIDDDCDGLTDEGVLIRFFADADQDGFGNPLVDSFACSAPIGFVNDNNDCDDQNSAFNPLAVWFRDADNDGFGNVQNRRIACIQPNGFVADSTDCNDGSTLINPSRLEICNGIDDNCNGSVDEGVLIRFFADADSDGFGNPGRDTFTCVQPSGFVANSQDCNDNNAAVNPNNVWFRDADGDGFGNISVTQNSCTPPVGFVAVALDCDDQNPLVNSNQTEICNNLDDNCNGIVDEGVKTAFFRDADGDGFGNARLSLFRCSAPAGYVINRTDCDDTNPSIFPGATEVCSNAIDDNCNNIINEGCGSCASAVTLNRTGTLLICGTQTDVLNASVTGGAFDSIAWYLNGVFLRGGTTDTALAINRNTVGRYFASAFCGSTVISSSTVTINLFEVTTESGSNKACPGNLVVFRAPLIPSASYSWTIGSQTGAVVGVRDTLHQLAVNNNVWCRVTAPNGCTASNKFRLLIPSTCSNSARVSSDQVKPAGMTEIRIQPNPNTGSFEVIPEFWNSPFAEFSIYDFTGREVLHQRILIDGEGFRIELPESLASGIYTLRVQGENEFANSRFEIRR